MRALHGDAIRPGDVLLGYASTGLHTNGYTLARRIVFERMRLGIDDRLGESGSFRGRRAAGRAPELRPQRDAGHLTSFTDWRTSPGAASPATWCGYCPPGARRWWIPTSWELPPLFTTLQQAGGISTEEMRDVFNLGVGLIAVLPPRGRAGRAGGRRGGRGRHLDDGRDPTGHADGAVRPLRNTHHAHSGSRRRAHPCRERFRSPPRFPIARTSAVAPAASATPQWMGPARFIRSRACS